MATIRLLTLYGRAYCHLCEDMIEQLRRLEPQHGFRLEVIDIEDDHALEAKYGDKVPVLVDGDEEICRYHFDHERFRAYLSEKR